MSYKVPDSPDTSHTSISYHSSSESPIRIPMDQNMQDFSTNTNLSQDQGPSRQTNPTLLPSHLWNLPYITHSPEILEAATKQDGERVSQLFASSIAPTTTTTPIPIISSPQTRIHLPIQPITPYDGTPRNLRSFCSQLVNQIPPDNSISETEKVRFAYQCLGTGALAKMRSSFRCLENPSLPAEITTLEEFLAALKQRCEDPSLRDQATTTVEGLFQRNTKFHEFITIFEDNMVDSIYSTVDKSHWKLMLERRLSSRLRNLILSASDVPSEYHAFVAYLRQKDAGLQEILATSGVISSRPTVQFNNLPIPSPNLVRPVTRPSNFELPVSQGGSAMDLDLVSRQKGADGRLTQQAKDARRTLGRCVWCNKLGHTVRDCPLGSRSVASIAVQEIPTNNQVEELKGQLQQ